MTMEAKSSSATNERTLQLSCFFLGEALCAIDIAVVQEIDEDLTMTRAPLAPDYIVGVMNLRGQIVTVIDLKKKIGLPGDATDPGSCRIIIVVSKGECVGLLVDRVSEVITVRESQITEPPANFKGLLGKFFKGIIETTDHHLLNVIDVNTVLTEE